MYKKDKDKDKKDQNKKTDIPNVGPLGSANNINEVNSLVELANALIIKGKKESGLKNLYLAYKMAPSFKLEKKIYDLEEKILKSTYPNETKNITFPFCTNLLSKGYSIYAKKKMVQFYLDKSKENKSFFKNAITILKNMKYLTSSEKSTLFHFYLTDGQWVQAFQLLIDLIPTDTNANFLQEYQIVDNDLILLSNNFKTILNFFNNSKVSLDTEPFHYQDYHIRWLYAHFNATEIDELLFSYLINLKESYDFDRGNKFFSLSSVTERKFINTPRFYALFAQFFFSKITQSFLLSKKMTDFTTSFNDLKTILIDSRCLKAFSLDDFALKKNIMSSFSEIENATGTNPTIEFILFNNPYQILGIDRSIFIIKDLETKDILKFVAMRLKEMTPGTDTPKKLSMSQKILLNKNYSCLAKMLYGYPSN